MARKRGHKIDTKIQISTNDLTNKYWILKEHDRTESDVKKLFEKANCFKRYNILKGAFVSKNSNKMAGNSKIKAQ